MIVQEIVINKSHFNLLEKPKFIKCLLVNGNVLKWSLL